MLGVDVKGVVIGRIIGRRIGSSIGSSIGRSIGSSIRTNIRSSIGRSIGSSIQQQDTKAGLTQFLGWPEVLISFSLTLSHSVQRHYTSCRGVSPTAEAVPIRSLMAGRLASGGDRTRNPLPRKRA